MNALADSHVICWSMVGSRRGLGLPFGSMTNLLEEEGRPVLKDAVEAPKPFLGARTANFIWSFNVPTFPHLHPSFKQNLLTGYSPALTLLIDTVSLKHYRWF